LTFDLEQEQTFKVDDESIALKVVVDRNPGFTDPIDLQLGKKTNLFSLEPVTILPEENEKTIHIKINRTVMEKRYKNKKNRPMFQMNISGVVKGEWVKQGKGRQVQIAKYSEMTPIFILKLER
jgi:hypothetical protein